MATLTVHQDVQAPLRQAFAYFTDFERYPRMVKAVQSVSLRDPDESSVRFGYRLGGMQGDYVATINIDSAGATLSWHSTNGPSHAGVVAFRAITGYRCALTVEIDFGGGRPAGITEAALGMMRGRIEHGLQRFAVHVEEQIGRRSTTDAPDYRAPSERAFDAVFPTDETRRHS